jgi:hypothetical protein
MEKWVMKNMKSILFSCWALAFVVGCSSPQPKEAPQASNQVVDAGMYSSAPVKVKETHVYDAGVYRENEDYSDLVQHGGKNGDVIPTEKFYGVDREKHVPTDKVFYILTEDNPAHCIKGKYIWLQGRKQLVVYSKSSVPTNYCIYQKKYSSEPEGFSIYITEGGLCRPSFTTVTEDEQKRKVASVEQVKNTVSMTYCVENTVSYGEEFARRHH